MIVFFHEIYIATRYLFVVCLWNSFSKNHKVIEDCRLNASSSTSQDILASEDGTIVFAEQKEERNGDFKSCNEVGLESGDENKSTITFFPPVYIQRYLAVFETLKDERWKGNIKKVVDFGCSNMAFFPYLKQIPGISEVFEVDIDETTLEDFKHRCAPLTSDYLGMRSEPLQVYILSGSIADREPHLEGTDAVVCIELIEHLYPPDLEELPFTVFGFIQPKVAIFTTPNADFNVLFPNLVHFRHDDHKFEWTREQFECWGMNITKRYTEYQVSFQGVGKGPQGTEHLGCCSQMAVFHKTGEQDCANALDKKNCQSVNGICSDVYKLVREYMYPVRVDTRTEEEKILQEAEYWIRRWATSEETDDSGCILVSLDRVYEKVSNMCDSVEKLQSLLNSNWEMKMSNGNLMLVYPYFREVDSDSDNSDNIACDGYGNSFNQNTNDYENEWWSDGEPERSIGKSAPLPHSRHSSEDSPPHSDAEDAIEANEVFPLHANAHEQNNNDDIDFVNNNPEEIENNVELFHQDVDRWIPEEEFRDELFVGPQNPFPPWLLNILVVENLPPESEHKRKDSEAESAYSSTESDDEFENNETEVSK